MQRLILIILTLIFSLSSCKKRLPEGILSDKEFIALLTEVHTLDGYIVTLQIDSARKVINPLYQELFSKYDLDSTTFKKNIEYYYGNPKLNAETYEQIVKNLEAEERGFQKLDSIKNALVQDSINRVFKARRKIEILDNMIKNAKSDSLPLTPADYSRRTFELSGIMFYLEKNFYNVSQDTSKGKTIRDLSVPVFQKPIEKKIDSLKEVIIEPKDDPKTKPVKRPDNGFRQVY